MLKQELEHERKMEVETLQSEFQVQLEVELKRQAAQLSPEGSAASDDKSSSPVHEVKVDEIKSDCYSANNNAIPVEESFVQQSFAGLKSSEQERPSMEDNVDPLMQTSAFELQQTAQGAHNLLSTKAALADDAEDFVEGMRRPSENLSDDSKASTSPLGVPSPMHSSTPMPKRVQVEPLTDMEKEMEALRQEYEAKFAELKAERDAAEERYDRLMQGNQEED